MKNGTNQLVSLKDSIFSQQLAIKMLEMVVLQADQWITLRLLFTFPHLHSLSF